MLWYDKPSGKGPSCNSTVSTIVIGRTTITTGVIVP